MKRILLLVGMVFFLTAGHASATILYTFSGVTFAGGGTLTGTFTTNDAITALIGFDITTSAGAGIGFHYTPATAGSSSTSLPFIIVLSTPTLDNILQVTFSGGLTALGAPILIGMFDSFEQATAPARRNIVVVGVGVVDLITDLRDATLHLGLRARAFDDRPARDGCTEPAGLRPTASRITGLPPATFDWKQTPSDLWQLCLLSQRRLLETRGSVTLREVEECLGRS